MRKTLNISISLFKYIVTNSTDGDMGIGLNAKNAYMKQKHRLIWERRHGPVGSGMRDQATKA